VPAQPVVATPPKLEVFFKAGVYEPCEAKLLRDWPPQQISGWLKRQYPNDGSLHVSHDTIYRSLFIQARGALKQELIRQLPSKRRIRRSRHASVHGHSQGRIVDAISPDFTGLGQRSPCQ